MSAILYAALGGNVNSNLYTVNPSTGAMASIGPIGFAVTGLAFDPTSGTLYGVTSNNSPSNPRSLITVDPTTGAGTLVGPLNTGSGPAADISFDSTGQLYGWVEGVDDLYSIDKATGTSTDVGPSGFSSFGDGMSFDATDILWACIDGGKNSVSRIYTVDTSTGLPTPQSLLTGGPFGASDPAVGAASFDAAGVFWAVFNNFPICHLVKINVSTGVVTDVGVMLNGTDALAWGPVGFADDFSVSLTPSALTISEGASDTTTLSTTVTAGSAQSVALSATGQPAAMTISFASNPITSGTSTVVTVAVGATVPGGTYTVVIHLVGSLGATHTASLTVNVPNVNVDCEHAMDLNSLGCFGQGSLTFTNFAMPTTAAGDDPFNTVYGLGFHWERQAWFKLTNTSAVRAYVQISLHNPEAVGIYFAAALYYNCPSLTAPSSCLSRDVLTIWDSLAAHTTYPDFLGVVLEVGQSVWVEIAGDDDEGSPAGWDGPLTIAWTLYAIPSYDGFDDGCAVDVAAFSGTPFAAEGISYCRRGSDDFLAVNHAGALEVWKYTGGVRTVYSIASFGVGDGNVMNGTDFAAGVPNTAVLLRTDGTDVWLAYLESKIVANPYVAGTWQPWRVEVRHFNGSAFTVINNDAAKTLNTPLYGVGTLDAAASPADLGILHVFWSEGGTSTVGNRTERVAYSKWSTSARLSQSDLLTNTAASAGFPNGSRLVTQYLRSNNADGAIRAFYGRPLGAPASNATVYSNVIEMWDVTAGAATILQTVTLSAFDVSYTHLSKQSALIFGSSRRPVVSQAGVKVIYLAMPVDVGPDLLLSVASSGASAFSNPDFDAAESLPTILPYDVEDDGRNIYAGLSAAGAFRVYSRACPTAGWKTYNPNPTALLSTNVSDDILVNGDDLYLGAETSPGGSVAPLVWPILRSFFVCSLGAIIQCNTGGAVFDGAPAYRITSPSA